LRAESNGKNESISVHTTGTSGNVEGYLADAARNHNHNRYGFHYGGIGVVIFSGSGSNYEFGRQTASGYWWLRVDKNMTKRWYIVHAYSNFEKKVAESIQEQALAAGLDDLFEEVLVPTEEAVSVKRGRKIKSERKFFPGYVLVKMEMTDQAYHLIKNTPKVSGFLGSQLKPMPITEDEANRILHQVQEGIERPKPLIAFEIGEQVRVADGPFASFNGYVEDVDEEKARLKVAVSIFGRATPVELEYGQVEKV
jgi:transcription termination/antitermination protein NusG